MWKYMVQLDPLQHLITLTSLTVEFPAGGEQFGTHCHNSFYVINCNNRLSVKSINFCVLCCSL